MSAPLVLAMIGGHWFIGEKTKDGLRDPFEYHGQVQVAQGKAEGQVGVRVIRAVTPVEALVSLRELRGAAQMVVPLTDLSREDQRDIERHHAACQEMVAALRANQAGIVTPRLVLPEGVRRDH
jgi:hypothetical protein